MSSESDSDEDIFDRRNKASRRDPPREVEDASDVDEDDEDLDAILQPGRYKVKATTQPTGKATAAKQMSREELMGEIYGKKTPRGRKRKADPVPAPKTTAKSKRTGDEPSAIEPDALDDEPSSATVGSVLKRSRPTATNAKGKEVLPVDTSIVLSDSDEDDLELEHLHYDDAPIMNLNSFSETSAYLPPAVVESLRLARESQAIASRLRQSDPLNDSPIRSTSTTSSSARPSSSPAAAVLLSLLCPLTSEVMKFRILKSQPFSLLLNEYIKKKKEPLNTYLRRHSMTEFLSDHKKLLEDGGFVVKFDGMPVQASQTPQDFGMLENETLQLALPPPPLSWVGDLEKEVGLRLSSRTLPTPQPASVQLDDEEAEEEEEADADYVILRLRREGQEEKFRIDQDKQFQKLHDSYCQKKRLIPEKVKFIFDGLPLNMRSTPANEDMEDDDIVDVKVEPGAQLPAVAAATAAATTAAASASKPQPPRPAPVATYVEDDDDDSAYVLLRVRRGTEEDKFRIKRSDPFKKLQEAYCKKKGLKMAEARFVFDGLPLKGNQTAEGQDMEDEDIIDVEDN